MPGAAFVAKVPEADRTLLGNGLCEEVLHRVGRPGLRLTFSFDPDITEGGVTVEDAEARRIWDNGLLKRLDRLWPELRRQIALEASFVPKTESGEQSQ
jgi:vacuolar-type H+-ATPase subunit E/Vma4